MALRGLIYVPPEKTTYEIEVGCPLQGDFTGVSFKSPRTGQLVRVSSRKGESTKAAITRVKAHHKA